MSVKTSQVANKLLNYGYDPGFGFSKGAKFDAKGGFELNKFLSVVAELKGEETGSYLLDDGKYYFVGEKALKQPKDNIIEVVDYQKLEKFVPILLLESLKVSNINPEDVGTIVTGLSISHKDSSHNFKERLSKFIVDGKEYKFNIILKPQGVGATTAIKKFSKNEPDSYIVIDLGFNTVDIVEVIDKEIMKNELVGFDNKGVITIGKKIQKYILDEFERDITVKNALSILENGKYVLRGKSHDLKEVIEKLKTEYTEELLEFLEKRYGEKFDILEKIYFVGGGAHFIQENYAENITVLKNPEYYNAIGNLLSVE